MLFSHAIAYSFTRCGDSEMKRDELIEKVSNSISTWHYDLLLGKYVKESSIDLAKEIIDLISPPIESKPFNLHSPDCELRKK